MEKKTVEQILNDAGITIQHPHYRRLIQDIKDYATHSSSQQGGATAEEVLDRIILEHDAKFLLSYGEKEMSHNGISYLMVKKDLVVAAMHEYASLSSKPAPHTKAQGGS